ncbi:FAD-dependent oxidoreductase [Pseudovibrio sp. POLY-S9]|uniref:FAD-dependent oxidoreductase n=1 Tax=Pseudovibrio sp. POLY-S9 TaxID=1576596 RepID=UPI001AD909B4|nr:FAD-dependent oxidoreductase [Pseudovibrio sp. POLY-S9]
MSLHRIFQEDAYGEQLVAENFWHRSFSPQALGVPLSDEQSCEVAVVGGGYTGLSAALKLAQQGVDVAVLDAQHIGWGLLVAMVVSAVWAGRLQMMLT